MRRFFAPPENRNGKKIILGREQSRHAYSVLRLHSGDQIIVFDGCGREFLCAIQENFKANLSIEIIKEIETKSRESDLEITLAAALLKGDKFALVIQKSVELGVAKLIPIVTRHCEVKAKSAEKKRERLENIAIEASKQCGRAKLMRIAKVRKFEDFVRSNCKDGYLFSEKKGESFSIVKADKRITAVIGPEGGWDDPEIDLAQRHNFRIITLGERILRAETATISIVSILQNRFGDLS